MTILNYTKQQIALMLGGSSTIIPNYMMIGSGSGAVVISQNALIGPIDRQAVTGSDVSTIYRIKWTGDWNSVELSGIQLREFGMCGSNTGVTGSMWSRTSIPAISFDGTNELRIEEAWTVY